MMDQTALIERSLELAAERCTDLTSLVFERLFRLHPQTEALFWRDGDGAIKDEMLAQAFAAILDFVGERIYAHRFIQCEAVNHAGYSVPPDVFRTFFHMIAATLHEVIGDQWTSETDLAWQRLLLSLDYYVKHTDQAKTAAAT